MWYVILLLGVNLSAAIELRHGTYLLDIDDGNLRAIRPTGLTTDVDLSSLQLRGVDKNAFDSVTNATALSLRNNSIAKLPEFVFANLTNLETLDLAENKLLTFENTFVGLTNLKLLNITSNPMKHLRKSYLFGLTKSADVLVDNNGLWSISTVVFENPFLRDPLPTEDDVKPEREPEDDVKIQPKNSEDAALDENLQVKICKTSDGLVTSVEQLGANETLRENCSRAAIHREHRQLILSSLKLKSFAKNWYKLQRHSFNSIDLSSNDIVEVTEELLNDLPADLVYVNLAGNKIEILRSGVVNNEHLRMLNFKSNNISVIEPGALQRTKLSGFFAAANHLRDTGFAATLPSTITEMVISQNEIGELKPGALEALKSLVYLNLAHNNVSWINSTSLRGLSSLQVLILTDNHLSTIEPNSFDDLISLRTLYLYRNNIGDLPADLFARLENLRDLNLAWNNFTGVRRNYFSNLPDSLRELHLDFNGIECLDAGSFTSSPRRTLSLDGNKIANIPRATFDLPHLHSLHLKNNLLRTIDGDSFEGLPRLRRLHLNHNRIETVAKGAARNLLHLHTLDISGNPVERLESGALFGLPKIKPGAVYVADTRLRLVQGGLFDDV